MSLLTLATVKEHLIVGHSRDDTLIQGYMDAARAYAGSYLRRDLDADFPDGLPADMEVAILKHVYSMYYARDLGHDDSPIRCQPGSYAGHMAHYRVFS